IEPVLYNPVDNAVKCTPGGTPIHLAASRDDGSVTIEVADAGPGLPPGSEERIFEKFERGGGGRGFGLGLTICRAIVDAHGGRIWAENRRPHGAAFRFTLPLGSAPPVPPDPEETGGDEGS